MPAQVVLTRTVQATLYGILDHIARDSPRAALAFIDDLESRLVATLGTFPEAGPIYQGDVRFHVVRGYAFLYRYDAESRAVWRGRRKASAWVISPSNCHVTCQSKALGWHGGSPFFVGKRDQKRPCGILNIRSDNSTIDAL